MDDEQLNQRIRYLIEHGGVWDDPLMALRRKMRWMMGMVAFLILLRIVDTWQLLHR